MKNLDFMDDYGTEIRRIKRFHKKYLLDKGIKLPKDNTRDMLVLAILSRKYPNTKEISKKELTALVREKFPNTVDVQQARHLSVQKGWYIDSGRRGNSSITKNHYKLVSLKDTYPYWNQNRRNESGSFKQLKKKYHNRCATCGMLEGDIDYRSGVLVTLEKGHKNPNLPLTLKNTIPQCSQCNQIYKDYYIFDDNGRPLKINNPSLLQRSDNKTIYECLKFIKRNNESIWRRFIKEGENCE